MECKNGEILSLEKECEDVSDPKNRYNEDVISFVVCEEIPGKTN
jgi:hypothetical protein